MFYCNSHIYIFICTNIPIKFAAWVPAVTFAMSGWRADIYVDDTGIGELAYHCRAGHCSYAESLPISGARAATHVCQLLPLLLLLPPPHCSVGPGPAQQCPELLWGMCVHAGVPALLEPSAHMQAFPPVMFPLLTCMLHCPPGLHLPITNSKIKFLRFFKAQLYRMKSSMEPFWEWSRVQWQCLHALEAGPADGPTVCQASGFELYIEENMRWRGNDGTDIFPPWP